MGQPLAVATNRFAAVILEVVSTLRFHREGKLTRDDFKLGVTLGVIAASGAALGSYIVVSLKTESLNLLIGVLLTLVTIYLLSRKAKPEDAQASLSGKRKVFVYVAAIGLGVYGGILGAGMGTLMTVLLVGSGLKYVQSSAICRCAGVIWSASASVVFALSGMIDWYAAVILSNGFSLGGWIGAGLGAKKGEGYIRLLLIGVIVASILKLLWEAL